MSGAASKSKVQQGALSQRRARRRARSDAAPHNAPEIDLSRSRALPEAARARATRGGARFTAAPAPRNVIRRRPRMSHGGLIRAPAEQNYDRAQ